MKYINIYSYKGQEVLPTDILSTQNFNLSLIMNLSRLSLVQASEYISWKLSD